MGLFKADLFRNFAFGFVLGAALIALQIGPDNWAEIVPHTLAMVNR